MLFIGLFLVSMSVVAFDVLYLDRKLPDNHFSRRRKLLPGPGTESALVRRGKVAFWGSLVIVILLVVPVAVAGKIEAALTIAGFYLVLFGFFGFLFQVRRSTLRNRESS